MAYASRRARAKDHSGSPVLTGLTHLPPFQYAPVAPFPFVGRAHEREQAHRFLARSGVVAITGIAGSGKTALAAAILQETGRQAVWIEIAPGMNDRVEPFLWQLAQPLADVMPTLWRALHQAQQAQWGYPPLVRLHMILEAYASFGQQMTICIDRVEKVMEPALEALITEIVEHVAHMQWSQLNLIAAGRILPYVLGAYALPALRGLDEEAIALWAQQLAVNLDKDATETIYRQTAGLPQPINLLFKSIFDDPSDIEIDPIVARQEVRHFLTDLIGSFSTEEQELLAALALGPGLEKPVSFSTLRQLQHLERSHLTTTSGSHAILVHPFIQHFLQFYGE